MRDLADELLQAKVRSRLFGGDHAPRLGRLVILDKLGAGAMGTVYAAYDPKLDRKVAVKVMHATDPAASQRVLREARALAKLAHPNIVTIHDAGEDDGMVYVVMELATGVPLRAWIASPGVAGARSDALDNPDRTWREVVRVMADVAAGLAAAHRAGLVHRDVKPENILVGERARLVDFGLAFEPHAAPVEEPPKLALDVTDADGSTTAAELDAVDTNTDPLAATDLASLRDGGAGTPAYMAPEILAGGEASAASDQFSFAVTLFEALHGERSHAGTTRAELHAAALHAADATKRSKKSSMPEEIRTPDLRRGKTTNPTLLTDGGAGLLAPRAGRSVGVVPAWIDAIVRRGLAANPADRFATMDALLAELTRDRTRRRRAIALAGVALLAGTGVGVLAFRGHAEPAPQISCDGKARLDAIWNVKSQGVIRERFGDAAWTTATLDGLAHRASDWAHSFRNVCEATRVRGEQSDRLLELRMRCLDRTLSRFDAFVDALQAPLDLHGKIDAASAVDQLPLAATCETVVDDPTLELPADPKVRAEAAAIEAELDHAWASYAIGRYTAASTQAIALSQRVNGLDVPALQASVLLLGGTVESRIGDGARARKLLEYAVVHAARAKAAELELAIWTRLFRQELFGGRQDRVIEFGSVGEAAAIRAGHEGGEIFGLIGEALRAEGKLDGAKQQLERALASKDPLREDQRAMLEMNLGAVELALGHSKLAVALHERALARSRKALGDGHPTLALHYDKLGEAARAQGRIRDALHWADQSRDLRLATLGDEDRAYGTSLLHRAETLLEAGRLGEAMKDALEARAIRVKIWGKDSRRLAEIDALLGDIDFAANRIAEARARYTSMSELDPERSVDYRTITVVKALGVRVASPLDQARLLPIYASLGMDHTKLQLWRLVRDVGILQPLSLERAQMIAAELSLMPRDTAAPLVAPFLDAYRKEAVDAGTSLAVADALLAAGNPAAKDVYAAALAALADEPSRERLHALRGLGRDLTALTAAMPELR